MNTQRSRLGRLLAAELFSPKDFVRRAALILILFGIAHALGLRAYTSIISGTIASPQLGAEACALLGMIYMALYFSAVVLVPILLIAAALLTAPKISGLTRSRAKRLP